MHRPFAFLLCAAGIGALCLMDAMVKYLALDHGVLSVTFARYGAGAVVAALIWAAAGRPRPSPGGWRLHLLRGTLIAVMAVSFFWSITQLPLALVICITFIAPLLMPPMAALFLNEPMQRRYVLGGIMGFGGVIVAVGAIPDLSGDRLLAVGAALFAAVCYGGSAIVLRARAAADGAVLVTLISAVVPAIILSPAMIGAPVPSLADLGWFVALGIVGNAGVQLLARSYAHIEAQAAAVMEFTALPWAALFGWFLFGEPVAPATFAGAAIIAAACLWASRADAAPIDPQQATIP